MSFGPESDRTVRDAVDAFLDGRLHPDLPGETWFETRNSRYTLRDGVLVGARATALIGAELVGWLDEHGDRREVLPRWAPGSKAVLVDRSQGRHLVVTSAVRRLGVDERERSVHGSSPPPNGSMAIHLWADTTTAARPAQPVPPATTPPMPLSARPLPFPLPPPLPRRVSASPPPVPAGAQSPLTALAQAHRKSLGARAAAALATKGLAAPGVPLSVRRPALGASPNAPPTGATPGARALADSAVVPSD